MRSTILALAAMATLTAVSAADVKKDVKDMTKEERRARRNQMIQQRYGGFIKDRSTQRGAFLFVNAQKTVAEGLFAEEVEKIGGLMCIETRLVPTTESVSVANGADVMKKLGGQAAVFLVANDDLPPMLMAPEGNWAIVNVTALLKGAADESKIKKRMACELWRSFAFLTQGYSADVRSVMQEVKDVKEFDDFVGTQFGPDAMMSIPRHLKAIGIYPYEVTTYRALCGAGKAPSPTNEFQKAIWDEFHAIPTKPIAIEPEKKPVKK